MVARFWRFIIGFGVFILLSFASVQFFHIPAVNLTDWLVGGAIFAWLMVIVTVPWNIHFTAREVMSEADNSKDRGIRLDSKKLDYVKLLATRSLWIAIALHLISTAVLYYLAANGITNLGYVGAIAALLLTVLRPIVRGYIYLTKRLASINQEFHYPREDVVELRARISNLEITVSEGLRDLRSTLSLDNPISWASKQQRYLEDTRSELQRLSAMQEEQRATNQLEHERIRQESKQLVSQITADGQFLDHAREIIRFFKSA